LLNSVLFALEYISRYQMDNGQGNPAQQQTAKPAGAGAGVAGGQANAGEQSVKDSPVKATSNE
jgi:hypothetical protein